MRALRGRTVGGRRISVYTVRGTEVGLADCQLLYVDDRSEASTRAMQAAGRLGRILTVGDIEHFVQLGGMIQIVRNKNRFGFVIAPATARRSGLRIASPLLDLATIHEEDGP